MLFCRLMILLNPLIRVILGSEVVVRFGKKRRVSCGRRKILGTRKTFSFEYGKVLVL